MKKLIHLVLIIAVSTHAFAQKLNVPIPNNPAVKVGTLKNGFKYYILKNAEPKNRMELRLVVNAGSILETDAQQGLAHFMEHMNFNGTKEFPKNDLVNFLQKSGMKFGADLNASTSFDETIYQLQVPTDSVKLFERAFQILADWSNYATLDTAEINKERGIILEEERARGKNAQARIQQKVLPILFNNSRYANRIPIGKTDIIQNFKPEEIIKFYKDWYRPDLMAVIAVGDFDAEKVENLIKEKFSAIKMPKNAPKRIQYEIPATTGTQTAVILDKEIPQNTFQMFTRLPKEKTKTQSDYRTDIAEALYNQLISNRLQELSKKPNAPFVVAIMNYGSFLGGLDAFQTIVLPKNADGLEAAIKSVIDEQNRIKKFGFTKGELERAKKDYFTGVEKGFKEKDKTKSAAFVGGLVQNYLQGTAYTNADFRYEFTKAQLDGITIDEVNAISNKVMKEDNRVAMVVGSEKDKDKLPNEAKIKELVSYVNPDLKPYEDDIALTPILEKIPVGTKVISEKQIPEIGVTELVLGNGVKVALKPTNFKNDQILFSATSKGGTSLYSDADYISAELASTLVSQGGVSKLSDVQLDKALAGKVAQVYTYIGEISEGIGGSTSPKDLETALQLMYAYVTQPRRDDEVIKNFLKNEKELLANAAKTLTPEKVFSDTVTTVLYQNHFRRQPTKPEDIDKANVDRAFEIFKERFADFSDFTFVFVGTFEIEKIKPLIEKYIGGLPSTKRQETFKDLGISKVKGKIEKNVYKGLEDKARVSLQFNGDFGYSEEELINLDALSEVLDIKLTEKLREEAGGVYTPSIRASYEKLPKSTYNLTISFGCSPANVDKLVKITLDEIAKIKANGPEKVDVEKVIAEEKREVELQVKENGFWNSYLLDQYSDGEDLNFINRFQSQLIDKISVGSIQKAANQFCTDNIAKFVLLPEKK
ncbi:peptidase M16 domain protein [Emticicia oligotrophica DSM 17448]|uniref:Peptidase M16 domain protein n=1 Tax=Emticicia oligotrophica (strain DSM 17448 / CIP 109782 / MTCC 6937 / GPTSA100-15) TaxID=929562 RepID=A0ABM5N5R0_EMTOG|nr:M16 family metallopeptidase [Emticicia oligotrophica]AFK04856.1 peptidase M16 domain protein [Emticicia oligotrophica DSM 17448]